MDNSRKHKDHLMISVDKLPETVLLPGDPGRVYEIANCLENVKEVGNNRSYITITGDYKGHTIAVCSSGIGGPSTEIAVVELHRLGVKNIIRIGTSGGLSKKLAPGDLVVLTSCARYSGTTSLFVPENYPAVSDYRILSALLYACEKNQVNFHVGMGLSVDSFYATKQEPLGERLSTTILEKLDFWINSGALQLDMEAATLFVLAKLLGMNAGAICTVGSNLLLHSLPKKAPSNEDAIKCACEAAFVFNCWKKAAERYGKKFILPPISDLGCEENG